MSEEKQAFEQVEEETVQASAEDTKKDGINKVLGFRAEERVHERWMALSEQTGYKKGQDLLELLMNTYENNKFLSVEESFKEPVAAVNAATEKIRQMFMLVINSYESAQEIANERVAGRISELVKVKAEKENEIITLKATIKKLQSKAVEADGLRNTIAIKDETIANQQTAIQANEGISSRLDAERKRAEAAAQAAQEAKDKLAELERLLSVSESKVALLSEQAEKAAAEADSRLEAVKAEFEARIESVKAEGTAATDKAEATADKRVAEAEANADKRVAETKAEADRRASEIKADAAERIAKLESDVEAKNVKIAELSAQLAAAAK